MLPAFDFLSIGLEPAQLLQTDLTSERKCSNDNCFCLVLFIFSIMFARLFLRNKHKRVKAFFGCIIFLLTITKPNLLTKNDILKSTSEIFTYESIDACNLLHTSHIHNAFVFFALSKFKYRNKDSFFKLLLLLSGDISLNPGPSHIKQTSDNNEWDVFKARGLHFIHININSLLPKIEELHRIACQYNAAVIGISESKLGNSIFDSDIEIDGYNTLRFDRNRHGGGVACYVRNDLGFTERNDIPHDIETIFIEIFLSKTKPMTVGIVYRPPSQTSFLETMNEHFYKLDTINKETYILGDFNINLYLNNKYVFEKCSTIVSNTIPYDVRKYQEFCNVFNLKQLISCPTRITCSSSTIIDHILASYPDRVSQKGIIDIGISDHQLIFCTRKTLKTKTASHKQISFRSLKNYSAVTYEETLKKVKFPNYENFININEAYSNFIQKLTSVIDEIAPCKTKRVKGNSKEWFDSVVSEGINNRDKLFKKFKKSRLPLTRKTIRKPATKLRN